MESTQVILERALLERAILEKARALADEVFFPAANEVDKAETVPRFHQDLLSEAGLYGLNVPVDGSRPAIKSALGRRLVAGVE